MTTTTTPQRRTIADGIRQQMIDGKRIIAWRGDPDLLLGGFLAATTTRDGCAHPFARIDRSLAAMNASPLFRRAGCILACDSRGAREILHPVFVLVERDATGENGTWGPKDHSASRAGTGLEGRHRCGTRASVQNRVHAGTDG